MNDDKFDFSFEESRLHGFLWAFNRMVLHPRGFALGFRYPDEAAEEEIERHEVEPIGLVLYGDGSESWGFANELDDSGFQRFWAFLDERTRQ